MTEQYTPREFRRLWPEFSAESWSGWACVEDLAFGVEPEDPELARQLTGLEELPETPAREVWCVAGRGAGKSRWAARLAVYFAAGRSYPKRAAGERIFCGIFAPDRKQAQVTYQYVRALLRSVPALERMVGRELRDSLELSNGVTVEVITAGRAQPRGRSFVVVIVEEAAFLPQEDSADPDRELLRAIRPALARVPGSLLVVVSSPYARRGELWRTWKRCYGQPGDVLVVQASTELLNPSFDRREIERAYAEDPVAAAAEYGAEFRSDVETFVTHDAVAACVVPGRLELPPLSDVRYSAFVDPSGGGADSFTLAIGHTEPRDGMSAVVVDCVRERRPPFSPESVVAEYAGLLGSYGVKKVVGDRYAGEWPREAFARHGVTYEPAKKPKSDLYRDALALLNAGRIELLDSDRLVAQLVGLERRTARGGRDSIDHAPGQHDDLANVVAGLSVLLAVQRKRSSKLTWGEDRRDDRIIIGWDVNTRTGRKTPLYDDDPPPPWFRMARRRW